MVKKAQTIGRLVVAMVTLFTLMKPGTCVYAMANHVEPLLPTSFGSKNSNPFTKNPVQLNVIPIGHTPKSLASSVQRVIQRYQIVNGDMKALQMGAADPVQVYVAQNSADYEKALQMVGMDTKQAASLSNDTAGFTLGNTIIVPMFQNTTTADLANTLAHELTHALFNLNVGSLPSWLNEGLAVSDGMYAQARVQGSLIYGAYARQQAESVLDAVLQNQLVPLAVNESAVYNAPYNVELQDWLSLQYLLKKFGYHSVLSYFERLKLGESEDAAFVHTFGYSFSRFNQEFTSILKAAAVRQQTDVRIGLSIPDTFHGDVRILMPGSKSWTGFVANPGTAKVTVTPSGKLIGVRPISPVKDPTNTDDQTLYVELQPDTPFTYQGRKVKDCGFSVNYRDNLYGYNNTWMTLSNGQTIDSSNPSLFGIQLMAVSEQGTNNPLIPLLLRTTNPE